MFVMITDESWRGPAVLAAFVADVDHAVAEARAKGATCGTVLDVSLMGASGVTWTWTDGVSGYVSDPQDIGPVRGGVACSSPSERESGMGEGIK